jgi:hypothetical protein
LWVPVALVSARCEPLVLVLNEPVSRERNEPVADVSMPCATSIVTVGTTGRAVRALFSSTTLASWAGAAGGFFVDGASLKRPCSATLTRMTEGEPKNVCR